MDVPMTLSFSVAGICHSELIWETNMDESICGAESTSCIEGIERSSNPSLGIPMLDGDEVVSGGISSPSSVDK